MISSVSVPETIREKISFQKMLKIAHVFQLEMWITPKSLLFSGCSLLAASTFYRRVRQEVRNSPQEELGDGEGMVDDDFFPNDREIREVTHVWEEDVETTEGEGVDFLSELLDLSGWTLVDDDETETELPWLHKVLYY